MDGILSVEGHGRFLPRLRSAVMGVGAGAGSRTGEGITEVGTLTIRLFTSPNRDSALLEDDLELFPLLYLLAGLSEDVTDSISTASEVQGA